MRALIEKGYLYIAQPPLFKVKRGNASELYLKNEMALDEYLIDVSIDGVLLKDSTGVARLGNDLRDLLIRTRTMKNHIQTLSTKVGNRDVVEQGAMAGALDEKILGDEAKAKKVAEELTRRMLTTADAGHQSGAAWKCEFTVVGGYTLSRTIRGVTDRIRLTPDHIRSPEAIRLNASRDWLLENFENGAMLVDSKGETIATAQGPVGLYEAIQKIGRKGLTIQRYKGLGEMNPEQLWETTLDPDIRTLLQVNIKDAEKANEIFSTLMGDVVEPRRKFIQDNALKVTNLDV
jgi:DNA gyrase subunit B